MSDVIFIAGYYRSGTSALSGALAKLGVTLHNDAEANEHNPLGFYEIPELIEWDVGVFKHLGVDWTDVRGLPEGWSARADIARHATRLDEILRARFAKETLWGLKHPHLCRLFPLYERAVSQAGHRPHVIHIARSPWTVAASQQRKNGLARAHAVLLWLSYVISGERHARHLKRAWLTYQDLLAEPASQIRKIEQALGLDLVNRVPNGLAEARGFLTSQLNRSEPAPQDTLFRPLHGLAERVWSAIQDRDMTVQVWDGFAAETAQIVDFLSEIGNSRGVVIPGFGAVLPAANLNRADKPGLRPAERLDDGARRRLLARAEGMALPSLHVILAVPPDRAHAVHETLEAFRGQWHAPAAITILSADTLELPDYRVVAAPAEPGALTERLCEAADQAAQSADYVALINAGDTIAPDACLRFALAAAESAADMLYCDEIVPADGGPWVRHKPGWDVTRLRQAAYVGDWVWYRGETLRRLGGLDPARAGAEEYDLQLRLAEHAPNVVRLPEALFTRAALSRRDNIPSTLFGARASEAVASHLARCGQPAEVAPRQHLGLFRHLRQASDPGTATILLCDGAEVPMLDRWLKDLLSNAVQTGPIILSGHALTPQTAAYLTQVAAQRAALEDKVLAVPPGSAAGPAAALAAALALAILDARFLPATSGWAEALRARLADPGVVAVAARTLVQIGKESGRFLVQGPIVIGADTRLGAGHLAEDPGPGGWLAVDQEASAIAPVLLARRAALAGCRLAELGQDALWIDLSAQLRAARGRLVWTPDVSFVGSPDLIGVDARCDFRQGSPAAQALPWADPYHHPALSLHGDLLAAEQRHGLLPGAPADPRSVLLTGPAETGAAVLNAARAARGTGLLEASWVSEPLAAAELGRRAPSAWVRINPEAPAPDYAPGYAAVYTVTPPGTARPVIAAATQLYATSPALVRQLTKLAPRREVALWRPNLCRSIWEALPLGTGINSKPRALWIDEGIAPPWLIELINETLGSIAWIVVERDGANYAGPIARLRAPEDEQGWAHELSALAPHVLIRPADTEVQADHTVALMGAAAGCHVLIDERLDVPETLGAVHLPNRMAAWQRALQKAISDLTATLEAGRQARAACLALPSSDAAAPPWAGIDADPALVRAAE
ncbi:MAG: hypothetical protein B7Z80_05000 [Rhodospirillales bacterium 20-64-7]|nr:MAG: hypothetical protein B7Z80_05000 [Rhodospirillales bacterium 20-64-7]